MHQDRKPVIPGISQKQETQTHHVGQLSPSAYTFPLSFMGLMGWIFCLQAARESSLQVYVLCKEQFLSEESPRQLTSRPPSIDAGHSARP